MASYLWKQLSESEKEKIRKDAKKLILEFGESIEKLPERAEVFVEREKDVREEGDIESLKDEDFRKIMFENAPEKNKDFILGGKGAWVK